MSTVGVDQARVLQDMLRNPKQHFSSPACLVTTTFYLAHPLLDYDVFLSTRLRDYLRISCGFEFIRESDTLFPLDMDANLKSGYTVTVVAALLRPFYRDVLFRYQLV